MSFTERPVVIRTCCSGGSVVERSPRDREVVGSILDTVIPKTL